MIDASDDTPLAQIRRVMEARGISPNPREAVPTPDEFSRHPLVQATDETGAAIADLYRPESAYHRMPWSALDAVMGGMPGGEVLYVAAFSSSGKTLFLTSLLNEYFDRTQLKIYYMGLESKPKTLRTHWAAKRLGLDAGDYLSGEFLKWASWRTLRDQLEAEIHDQHSGAKFERVMFCPTPFINAEKIRKAAEQALDFGADIFIIDHVDHIEGTGRGNYEQSVQANQAVLTIAQEDGFLMIPATQLNNDAVRMNPISLHLPPRPHHVKNGGHKREKATWMVGLYRPLKVAGVSVEDLKAVNSGLKNSLEICEPGTMAVSVLKHRFYGNREGSKVYLRVEKGKVLDANQALYTQRTVDGDGMRVAP